MVVVVRPRGSPAGEGSDGAIQIRPLFFRKNKSAPFCQTVNPIWADNLQIMEICHNTGFNEPKTADLLAQNM